MITRFWHVGLEVDDLEKGIVEYQKLGFFVKQRFEKDEPKSLAAHMDHPNGSSIELWQFIDKSHELVRYIKQHMAFVSDDLDKDIQDFVSNGYELVIPKTVGVTVTYAYIKDSSGNYIELAEQK